MGSSGKRRVHGDLKLFIFYDNKLILKRIYKNLK